MYGSRLKWLLCIHPGDFKEYRLKTFVMIVLLLLIITSCSSERFNSIEDIPAQILDNPIYYGENIDNLNEGYSWRTRDSFYDIAAIDLSINKLISTIWVGTGIKDQNWRLSFFIDQKFMIGLTYAGIISEGRYEILNKKRVQLTFENISTEIQHIFPSLKSDGDSVIFDFSTTERSPFYTHALTLNESGLAWYAPDTFPVIDSSVVWDAIELFAHQKKIVLIENAAVYESPGNSIPQNLNELIGQRSFFHSDALIFRGTSLQQLGYRIDDQNNEYRMILIPDYLHYDIAWILAESVQDYDESKKSEYAIWSINEWQNYLNSR
jgi:hypothetical protein